MARIARFAFFPHVALALAGIIFLLGGCKSGGDGNQADVHITFEPNPVNRGVGGLWFYTILVEERAGVGFTVDTLTYQNFDVNGVMWDQDSYGSSTFASEFDDCGGGVTYLPPQSKVCSDREEGGLAGRINIILTGRDDMNNDLTFSGSVNLNP